MKNIIIFHGTDHIIEKPDYLFKNPFNIDIGEMNS